MRILGWLARIPEPILSFLGLTKILTKDGPIIKSQSLTINQELSEHQIAIINRCKIVLDAVLGINGNSYAYLILWPLSDSVVRQKLYEYYDFKGYEVVFTEVGIHNLFWIYLRILPVLKKPIPEVAENNKRNREAELEKAKKKAAR